MNKLLEYLKSFTSAPDAIAAMEANFSMKCRHEGGFVLFDYNQIDSPRKHPIVDLCRGVIVSDDLRQIVCRPFTRFYNYGEFPELEKVFDWSTATVDEKADGSLIKVWFNPKQSRWELGTRGSIFGDNRITTLTGEDGSITFKDLFLRAAQCSEEQFQSIFTDTTKTYLFELCTLENKVVTAYDGDQIYLLGVLSNSSDEEASDSELKEHFKAFVSKGMKNLQRPARYDLGSFEEAVAASGKLTGLKEGFVAVDGENRRMKVKSVAYVAAHHLRGEGVTPKRAVLLALAGEIPEFLSYFPEYTELLMPYQINVDQTFVQLAKVFDQVRTIQDQKEFALAVKDYPFSSILFQMRKGQNPRTVVEGMTTNAKLAVFKPEVA